jgi:hypothetical protein
MTLSIVDIRSASDEEWDVSWTGTSYATYFHSRKWAGLFNAYTRGKMCPAPLSVLFSDGLKALIPLTEESLARGFTKRFHSSPAGTYGGWLSMDHLTAEHASLLIASMLKRTGNLIWRINPYDEIALNRELYQCTDDDTYVLELSNGFDFIFRSWTKGHKAAVKQAQKAGVSVRQASGLEDFEAYYAIYEDSLRRWGNNVSSKYDWRFFKEIYKNKSNNEILWLAEFDNNPVAGALCLYSKNIAVYWHGAALEEYFSLRPVNILIYEAIRHACKEAYSWFDFNPSGGHAGVRAFKRSFGAKEMSCPTVIIRDRRLALVETLRSYLGH